jgi:hypothetical protein
MGGTRLFSGFIGDLNEVGRSYAKMKVRSDLAKLEKNMPAQLFQPGCKNAIYDGGCKLDRSLFQVERHRRCRVDAEHDQLGRGHG